MSSGLLSVWVDVNSYLRENGVFNLFQYNGKEKQDELSLGSLDYGARMYQADVGRFLNIDGRAHNYMMYSPFAYTVNNPINSIDYNGEFILPKDFVKKYKRIANYLKNGIQGILKNDKIVKELKKLGGFTDAQLKEAFTWGEGPVLNPENYPDEDKFIRFGMTTALLNGDGNYIPGSVY